jgi:dTDP-4-dehydrorhamnose reductase
VKKILLFGANGYLGKSIQKVKEQFSNYEIVPITREQCNAEEQSDVVRVLIDESYDCIVNCIALTDLDLCNSDSALAMMINERFPRLISFYNSMAKEVPIIHISSATVYGYDSLPEQIDNKNCSPKSVYAQTKLNGEKYILQHPNNYVIRTSWLYSGDLNHPKFVSSMFKKIITANDDEVIGVTRQAGCLTYVDDLSMFIFKTLDCILSKSKMFLDTMKNNGNIVNFCDKYDQIYTRYDVAIEIAKFLGKSLDILVPIDNYDKQRNVHEVMKKNTIGYSYWIDNLTMVLTNLLNQYYNQSNGKNSYSPTYYDYENPSIISWSTLF